MKIVPFLLIFLPVIGVGAYLRGDMKKITEIEYHIPSPEANEYLLGDMKNFEIEEYVPAPKSNDPRQAGKRMLRSTGDTAKPKKKAAPKKKTAPKKVRSAFWIDVLYT